MSATDTTTTPLDKQDERLVGATGLASSARAVISRVKDGDLGALPVLAGLVLICVIFQTLSPVFLSSANLVELAAAAAPVGVISIGIVLVLLVAQIDLSVGSMSGVASAILGVGFVQMGLPLWLVLVVAITAGVLVGLLYGWLFVAFKVPSFVITLSGLLALLGLQLKILGANGSINIPFPSGIVVFSQQTFLTHALSYVASVLIAGGYLASHLARDARRAKHGLSVTGRALVFTKAGALLVGLLVGCWHLNKDRGVSAPFALFVALVVLMNFFLIRTRWGRAVYAVGGSVEATRRAGISTARIYVSVFVLCSSFAALGGLLAAGRLATASISSGVGDTNLNAIAAAVIGGTSLFGGRGSAYSALLGTTVIGAIASGLTLLNLDSSVRFMITGGVLLIAVIVDSVSRRSRAAHGRA